MKLARWLMSKRRRACKTKVKFRTEKQARKAADSATKRTGTPWEHYPCTCGGWHVGHKSALAAGVAYEEAKA